MTDPNMPDSMRNDREIHVAPEKPTEKPGLGGASRWAMIGAGSLFIAFIAFAMFAPISGGSLAPGIVSPDGSRRVVQHLEGGMIDRIIVRDGDRVKAGDPLLTLNETKTMAERNIARDRLRTFQVLQARLEAEQVGQRDFDVPFDAQELENDQLIDLIARQKDVLQQSLDLSAARRELLTERAAQIESEIQGLNATIDSLRSQQLFIQDEIQGARTLTEKGLYARPRLLALLREETNIDGQVANAQSTIARLRGQISEVNVQRIEQEAQRQNDLAGKLAETRAELGAAHERLIAAEDVLTRTVVRSPIDGQVVSMRYATIGGVVRPGEPIVDVVPLDERLLIEARVSPTDIDIVKPGLEAHVMFTALPRNLPQIVGHVLTVSADAIVDERSGMRYFLAEVEVPPETLDELGISGKLTAGMPADVMIKTEDRTFMEYLTEPFRDSFRKAFRED